MFPWFVDRVAFQMYRWVISVQSGSLSYSGLISTNREPKYVSESVKGDVNFKTIYKASISLL